MIQWLRGQRYYWKIDLTWPTTQETCEPIDTSLPPIPFRFLVYFSIACLTDLTAAPHSHLSVSCGTITATRASHDSASAFNLSIFHQKHVVRNANRTWPRIHWGIPANRCQPHQQYTCTFHCCLLPSAAISISMAHLQHQNVQIVLNAVTLLFQQTFC